jgi:hypothetical protein
VSPRYSVSNTAAELWNLSVSSATVASLFAMALLDYLYFVGSPETKNAPHISGEQKKIEKSLTF